MKSIPLESLYRPTCLRRTLRQIEEDKIYGEYWQMMIL